MRKSLQECDSKSPNRLVNIQDVSVCYDFTHLNNRFGSVIFLWLDNMNIQNLPRKGDFVDIGALMTAIYSLEDMIKLGLIEDREDATKWDFDFECVEVYKWYVVYSRQDDNDTIHQSIHIQLKEIGKNLDD